MTKRYLFIILTLCAIICLVSCGNTTEQGKENTAGESIVLSGGQREDKILLKENKLLLPEAEYFGFQKEYPGIRWIYTFPDSETDDLTKADISGDDYRNLVRMIEKTEFQLFEKTDSRVTKATGGASLYCSYQQEEKKGEIEIKAVSDQCIIITDISDDHEESGQSWIADSKQLNRKIKELINCEDFHKDVISDCEKVVIRIYDSKTKKVTEKLLDQKETEGWNQILKNSKKVLDIDAEVPSDVAIEYTAEGKTYDMTTSSDPLSDGNIGIQGNYYKIDADDYKEIIALLGN